MTGPPRSSRACTRSSQPRRSVAGKPVSNRPRFIQYPPIRTTARDMDRHAHTRPDWSQWAIEQCELRETVTATTRRAGDSEACAMNSGIEVASWTNSTQVNRSESRIQDEDSAVGAGAGDGGDRVTRHRETCRSSPASTAAQAQGAQLARQPGATAAPETPRPAADPDRLCARRRRATVARSVTWNSCRGEPRPHAASTRPSGSWKPESFLTMAKPWSRAKRQIVSSSAQSRPACRTCLEPENSAARASASRGERF
jgi:hypothetical protein